MRRGWRRADSCGSRRPTGSLGSRRRSSPTCSTGSIGATRVIRSARSARDRRRRRSFQESAAPFCDSMARVDAALEALPDDVDALKAALVAERGRRLDEAARAARIEAELAARAARIEAELAVAKAKASEGEALI